MGLLDEFMQSARKPGGLLSDEGMMQMGGLLSQLPTFSGRPNAVAGLGQPMLQQAQQLRGERQQGERAQQAQELVAKHGSDPLTLGQHLFGVPGYEQLGAQMVATAMQPPDMTSLQKDLIAAGLKPGTPEYHEAIMQAINRPGTTVNVGSDMKLPANFMWTNPDNPLEGMKPIPGSPADPKSEQFEKGKIKEGRDTFAKLDQVQQSVDSYEELIGQHGSELVPGESKTKLAAAHTDLLMELKELYNLGVLNGPDYDLMLKIVNDPTSMSTNASSLIGGMFGQNPLKAQLNVVREKLKGARERAGKLYGSEQPGGQSAQSNDPLGIR